MLVLNLVVSCKKEEVKQVNRTIEDTSVNSDIDKPIVPWLIYLAATVVIDIVIELSAGQYSSTPVQMPNGVIVYKVECSGVGTCTIPSTINNNGGVGDGQPLSSEEIGFDFEVSQVIDAEYIKLDDGRIILTIKPESDGYNDFFYSDTISISKPYLIDNPIFIEQMGLESGSTILVSGEYQVLVDDEGQKYIIIQ